MGQIVKRKKKGRPSKADLARRAAKEAVEPDSEVRRSLRRRNVRYVFDFDDFVDEDDEEDEQRREKKLKLLLKVQSSRDGLGGESAPSRTRRVEQHAPSASESSDDGGKPLKKRKIDGADEVDDEIGDDGEENEIDGDDEEIRRREGTREGVSVPGTPSGPLMGFPLPDRKALELILDKLQKKDTYGVYAEPVDPEELPDYHDVIEHPMDFATVRKKLGNGSYSTLEQFESDVFLICTNAMQYNAPDTVYYKQAHAIQELAKKKFQRLRINAEHNEKDLSSEQKMRSNSLALKQIKKPIARTAKEPVGSDFSSGATLATAGDFQSGSNNVQGGGFERLTNTEGPIDGNTSLIDNNLDKAEDLQGRGLMSRFGRKPSTQDENRRATYNIASQPVGRSESVFTTFDGEIRQLVAVGLHGDNSYARSLARFAGTLGPIAWKVASRRIEKALPPGVKFGRGWVGDYEPLSTPVLMVNCSQKEPFFPPKLPNISDAREENRTSKTTVAVQERPITFPALQGKSSSHGASVIKPNINVAASTQVLAQEQSVRGVNLEAHRPYSTSGAHQHQSPRYRNNEPEKNVVKHVELNSPPSSTIQNRNNFVTEKQIPKDLNVAKHVELNCPPSSTNQSGSNLVAEKKQIPKGLDTPASQPMEAVLRNRNLLQPVPFKQLENNGFVARGLPNGKISSNSLDRNRIAASSPDVMPNQMMAAAATYFPHGQQGQGLSDPAQLMKMLAENAQKQQKSLNASNPSLVSSIPSSRSDEPNNAAAAAARAWMSIGAGSSRAAPIDNPSTHKIPISADSLYNPIRQLQSQNSLFRGDVPVSGMHFLPAKSNFPIQALTRPPVLMGNEALSQNRPVGFPQSIVTTDLSRFQVPSPRQGINLQRQSSHKQESVPPDLNIGFQSSGSPRQSSGVLVDSQQPDLALQL
ncbi:hypothetical protein NMG60_11002204 [Bertholletia excelsa]